MNRVVSTRLFITHPNFSLACYLLLIVILPLYGGIAVTMLGCAITLSAYIAALPQQFRTKNGSMVTAYFLLAFMWLATAFITALTLLGEIR